MNERRKASRAAIELIKRFEGYRATAAQVPGGGWTIGYGHTRSARKGAKVSQADAEALLIYDLTPVQQAVEAWIFSPLTQNQFDALTAFAFNVGLDNFRASAVLRRVNEGDMVLAACALEMWRQAEIEGERLVVDGLIRRRAAEKILFLTPPDGWATTPSAIVRPQLDADVEASLPKSAAEVVVSMSGEQGEARKRVVPDPQPEAPLDPIAPAAALADPPAVAEEPLQIAAASASRRIVHREVSAGAGRGIGRRGDRDGAQLWALGSIGLAMFAGAVTWGARAKATAAPPDTLIVASLLGFAGIVCVAGAVYFLLIRLGGRDA